MVRGAEVDVVDRDEALELLRAGPAGVTEWNRRVLNNEVFDDLVGAHLAGAYLVEAMLAGINLSKANLTGANLGRARLIKADLSGASAMRRSMR